ncbi:tetratricopeptide repeat protein 31 isoform X2 [Rhinoderma darwinii]|uniref:tetratricopeptide repeat protein 31 isoform X2 n=1 Tax=Rhinoderma darwinii TaxID=43563 RepID=UPI003F665D57
MEEDSDDCYSDDYYYYNDNDEDENCGFWDGVTTPGTYCGFRPSFLCSQDYNPFTPRSITREQADKNAEELLKEEKREKEKADKKRLKKKRQKDRKRQQRDKEVEDEKPVGEGLAPVVDNAAAPVGQDLTQDDAGDSVNEDDLDLGSSFVRQAQKKMENKPKPERKERSKETLRERGRDKSQDSGGEKTEPQGQKIVACPPAAQINGRVVDQYKIQQSMDLASIGNNLASKGSYTQALHYYTEAITLNPSEYRFLGNRSYNYERVGRYDEALQDAETALELQPHFIKGNFRRGKALKGLKRYSEAITAFQEVLSCDVNCVEAAQELGDCQLRLQELIMCTRGNVPNYLPQNPRPTPPNLMEDDPPRRAHPLTPRLPAAHYTRSGSGTSRTRSRRKF